MNFKVGSKGKLDGELRKRVPLIGKVNAHGVGQMMKTVGGGGVSADTSRAIGERNGGANGARDASGAVSSVWAREDGEDLLRAEASLRQERVTSGTMKAKTQHCGARSIVDPRSGGCGVKTASPRGESNETRKRGSKVLRQG